MHFTFVLAAFVGNAAAHGVVSSFKTDGAEHQGYLMNYYYDTKNGKALPPLAAWSAENLDNGFVSPDNYIHPDIICQKNGKPANLTVQVAAGGTIDFQWTKWAHFGPMMTYVAPCNGDCSAVDKATLKWVKIDEAGIDFDTQEWAARKMVNNNRTWTTKIPSTLAAGNYVFRHETIAVHGSNRIGGAQNYPQCFNIEITGSGTAKPEGVLGTKLYTPTDPGIYFNPYTTLKNYTIPGPPLFKDGNGGLDNGSVTSSIAKDQTTAPIIATTLVTSRLPKPTTFEVITNAFPTATSVSSESSPKPSASGCRAVRKGAGVIGSEFSEAAERNGITAVGGEGMSVGYAGGLLAGGGHSPMSPLYGMGADQVLSIEVVTADGRFVTANEHHNTDLFWALCAGGGSTFGVVTSYTVKVFPKIEAAIMSFSFTTSNTVSYDTFWRAVRAYWKLIPTFNAAGNYEYWAVTHGDGDLLAFSFFPWFAPNHTLAELKTLVAPLFQTWKDLGIEFNVTESEHSSYYGAWAAGFPREVVGGAKTKTAGRLFPTENFKDAAKFNKTFDALKSLSDKGGQIIGFGITGGPGPYPDNAVNPAWRGAAMWAISVIDYPEGSSWDLVAEKSKTLTNDWMKPWREVTPCGGAYASEADVTEPNFQQSFYGTDKYKRLLSIKEKVDPYGLFYALQGVGSERWYVTDQVDGIPTQYGRLCRI